ncbi:hypothetical protein HPODL_05260 [Ogataea parapolymorpha DL-1]|uniref:NADH dehydrogenase [ubiquinone] 1 beta subcomplex subunit 9 n=1 Tax=Ogataea parapolymorpha (strain ATCC 26012 / BCRC 20466 / JCM 22074 / NRRL Y-7560 / DL-1) TaxID=871575 RepID=W1QDP0_OGAPD|nr:hypothetical protein HPODL_05260 [Ogataea parapolymorpha DL-1]ESW98664.1 hypothetical protein HPODL_05260 [Ogataea parapolymorpha DL-1]
MSKTPVPFSPENIKTVASLYRRSLRTAADWINRRDFYRAKAAEIRLRFEQNRNVSDPKELKAIIDKTELMLNKFKHPDPIIPPQRPGGIMYDRNAPPRYSSGPVPFSNEL